MDMYRGYDKSTVQLLQCNFFYENHSRCSKKKNPSKITLGFLAFKTNCVLIFSRLIKICWKGIHRSFKTWMLYTHLEKNSTDKYGHPCRREREDILSQKQRSRSGKNGWATNRFIMNPSSQPFKEVFKGDIQSSNKNVCNFTLRIILEPLSLLSRQAVSAILDAIHHRFEPEIEPVVHRKTKERVVISFPRHQDAHLAYKLAHGGQNLYVNESPYRFRTDDSSIHLLRVTADWRIAISFERLPVYLSSPRVIKQILNPYCVVDYLPDDMDLMDDLTEFTCMARTQQAMAMPTGMIIKVSDAGLRQSRFWICCIFHGTQDELKP